MMPSQNQAQPEKEVPDIEKPAKQPDGILTTGKLKIFRRLSF